ncbi:MAG: MFS transporter [Lentisphaerae bacterium]|nr:MFS transporter [Lentisphaerota bacterium]
MRIYFGPALMDWLIFLVLFAVLYGAGERGLSTRQCAWLGGIYQAGYMVSSLLIGMLINQRNARLLLFTSTIASGLLGIFCLFSHDFTWLLTGLTILSFFIAMYFNAFQHFMRDATPPGGLSQTVGLYTLAWSLGAAIGILTSGYFYGFGPYALSLTTLAVTATILLTLLTYRPEARTGRPLITESEPMHRGRPVGRLFILIGWLLLFTSMFVQRPVHTFFPKMGASAGIQSWLVSLPLFLNMLIQGLSGLAVSKFPGLLYRRLPLVVFQLGGAALCGMLILWPCGFGLKFIIISLLGLCSGCASFFSVYYCSNSGNRSINIGVNECLVGLGSFAGLFTAEWRMASGQEHTALFQVLAMAFIVATGLQTGIISWPRRRGNQAG